MPDLITNPYGATRSQELFASKLLGAINKDYGLDDGKAREEGERQSKGVVVQVLDKWIAELTEFDGFNAAVHMEDDRDVCMQVYPPRGHAKFPNFRLLLQKSDHVFHRVFDGVCEARAEFYQHGTEPAHQVTLVHDKRRRGMDLLEIRLINLYQSPMWQSTMVDVFKLLESVLTPEED